MIYPKGQLSFLSKRMEALAKPCVREWLCVREGARINPVSDKIGVFLLKFERENDRARKVPPWLENQVEG